MNDEKFSPIIRSDITSWAKITVITPSFNRAEFISQAIESVLHQSYPNVEHIIVDGGSTDGTLDVLAKYPHLRVMSEPDQGMYDALNKGLKIATGEYLVFLNTDDLLAEGALMSALPLLENTETDAVAGQANIFSKSEDHSHHIVKQTKILTKQDLWIELIYANPAMNAWVFKRRVFEKVGGFDASYRVTGDRDFIMRFLLSGLSYVYLDKVLYWYGVHDDFMTFSKNNRSRFFLIMDENLRLAGNYLDRVPRDIRPELQRHLTRNTVALVVHCILGGNYKKAMYYAWLGHRYDSLWFVKFPFGLFRGLLRELLRKTGLMPSF